MVESAVPRTPTPPRHSPPGEALCLSSPAFADRHFHCEYGIGIVVRQRCVSVFTLRRRLVTPVSVSLRSLDRSPKGPTFVTVHRPRPPVPFEPLLSFRVFSSGVLEGVATLGSIGTRHVVGMCGRGLLNTRERLLVGNVNPKQHRPTETRETKRRDPESKG